MTERIPIVAEPDPANPGQAKLLEMPEGDTPRGAVPSSAVAADSVTGGDTSGVATAIPVGPLAVLGRLATGGLRSLSRADLITILNAAAASAGAADAGRLLKLGPDGLIDLTCLPAETLEGEENQAASVGSAGAVSILVDVIGGVVRLRGLKTGTPDTVAFTQSGTDVEVNVIIKDGVTSATSLWSSAKISADFATMYNIIANVANNPVISRDETPALGGALNLGGFAIKHDVGGANETEVLSIDASTPDAPVLKLMGLAAILAILTNIEDGQTIAWSAEDGHFVNVTPAAGSGGGTTVDLFECIAISDKAFVQSTPSPLKLASVQPKTPSANWEQAGVSGSTFTSCKYVGAAAKRHRVKFGASFEQTTSGQDATVEVVIRTSTDGVVWSDVAGTTREIPVGHRNSISVETTHIFQPDEYVELQVNHTGWGTSVVKSRGLACSVQIESMNTVEA